MARWKKAGQTDSRAGKNGASAESEPEPVAGHSRESFPDKSRHYWLDLFSLKTWDEFVTAGANISGFRKTRFKMVQKVRPGDYFVCYLTGLSRFVRVLEVKSEPYEDESKIWEGEPFSCRLEVRPVVRLEPETAVPISELKDRLSMFQNLKFPGAWSVHFRTSPAKLNSKPKAVQGKIGPATVPETDETLSREARPQKEGAIHTEMQWLLLKVGNAMGHEVWVARNDRSKSWNGQPFSTVSHVTEKLPLQFDEATNRTRCALDEKECSSSRL